ncbi:uncharacterized protein LOC127899255 [Citrus sinensis]|uniref:uncharacterized protein LOC127899255 n=1 Tax=Citrus sinensis TaxID=2711 RepID=UPI002277CC68|nr:uncharacterized protein LOC127899255 [Citrus sinensis]
MSSRHRMKVGLCPVYILYMKVRYPNWKLVGFQRAITDCNLVDLGIDGYQFTWERARGTEKWVEEGLDRAFAYEEWIQRFNKVKVYSLDSSCSDHLPILLDPSPLQPISRHNQFRFENTWLCEADCSDVIRDSWRSYTGDFIQQRIMVCGSALMEWGGHFARDFRKRIRECKKCMAALRGRRDNEGVVAFTEARQRYNELLHSHEVFWK